MRHWLTREEYGILNLWEGEDKPFLHKGGWNNVSGNTNYELPEGLFRKVTFENSPIEVDDELRAMDETKLREVLSAYLSKEDIDKVIKDYNDPNWSNYIDSRF